MGLSKIAEDLLLYDVFGLNLRNVVALIDERSLEDEVWGIEEHSDAEEKKFYHLPRLRREDLLDLDFDTAVVGNLIPEILNSFYPREAADRLVYLAPKHPHPVAVKSGSTWSGLRRLFK